MNPNRKGINILDNFGTDTCCGCGACINACPTNALSYSVDQYGFIIPSIVDDKCIKCGKCIKVCPYHNIETDATARNVFGAVNKSSNILLKSSSGGIFFELANTIIEQGGVVFGCTMDNDFSVKHISVDRKEDICKILRSKYVQSFSDRCFSDVEKLLKEGRVVLYSGTPCLVAGLKSYMGNRQFRGKLYTVDVVCHGVSSQLLFFDYLKWLSGKIGSITKYTFRTKQSAENGMQWKAAYETHRKKYIRNWPEDSYNYYYMKGFTHRDSCYKCPFASPHRYSDITLCDYWNWEANNLPFKYSDSVSGVITNTEQGDMLIEQVKMKLKIVSSDFNSLSKWNSALTGPMNKPSEREELLASWKNLGYNNLAVYFNKRHRLQIIKYRIMRLLPYRVIYYINKWI